MPAVPCTAAAWPRVKIGCHGEDCPGSRRRRAHQGRHGKPWSAATWRLEPLFFATEWAKRYPDATHTFFNSRATAWAKARHFRASWDHDAWSRLGSIEAPTLILHGTDDALTPMPNAVQLHQHIRRSTQVKVPGAGHGLHLDRPETIQWIRQFIAA